MISLESTGLNDKARSEHWQEGNLMIFGISQVAGFWGFDMFLLPSQGSRILLACSSQLFFYLSSFAGVTELHRIFVDLSFLALIGNQRSRTAK